MVAHVAPRFRGTSVRGGSSQSLRKPQGRLLRRNTDFLEFLNAIFMLLAKCLDLGPMVSYLTSPSTRRGAHGATQLGNLPILLSPAAVAPKSTTRHQVLADEEISCCKAVSRTGLTYQECRPPPVTQFFFVRHGLLALLPVRRPRLLFVKVDRVCP